MNKIFPWIAVLLWMAIIFQFSYQPAPISNNVSLGVTVKIVQFIEFIYPDLEINERQFNRIVRKYAHFFIYLVLGLIVMWAIRKLKFHGSKNYIFALGICVFFAISDEIHQLFVPGRGGQIRDVVIDSLGAVVGICLYLLIFRQKKFQ